VGVIVNILLQRAIISLLANPNDRSCSHLFGQFGMRDWSTALSWSDTRGITLYLHAAIRSAGIETRIPALTLARLEKSVAENRSRNREMLQHFHQICSAFEKAEVRFCAHKGFTYIPEFCPDLALRHQADLDFIVSRDHCSAAAAALEQFGYRVDRIEEREWLLKTHSERLPKSKDIFKPKSHRSAEFHFRVGVAESDAFSADAALSRSVRRAVAGETVPVLSAADQFIDQTGHLFQHLLSEWTRLSWLLELHQWLQRNEDNYAVWQEIVSLTSSCARSRLAIGTTLRMVQAVFQYTPRNQNAKDFMSAVPNGVQRWVNRFGEATFLAQYPGSKLYLLLLREVLGETGLTKRRLAPLHRPPVVITAKGTWSLRNHFDQLNFILLRIRFHAREAVSFWRANRTWSSAPKA